MAVTGSVMAAGSIGASVWGSRSASKKASKGQKRSMNFQLDRMRERLAMMKPYMDAGNQAFGQQLEILGLSGEDAQQNQINSIQNSPMFQSMLSQGEDSLLQNASATGGVRGGNTQAALAQFSPQLLNQQLNQQYERLGGITDLGMRARMSAVNNQAATSQQVAQGYQNLGNIGAARSMGTANAITGAIGQVGQMAMLGNLMGGGGPSSVGTSQNTYGVLQAQQAPQSSFGVNPGSFGVYGSGF